MDKYVINIISKLELYVKSEEYKGYDPYDGLNSSLSMNFKSKFARQLWTQLIKRSLVNLRPLVGIQKEYNPKGIGLILAGYVNLAKSNWLNIDQLTLVSNKLILILNENRSPGFKNMCWGYNFDWQSRAFFAPKGTPTIVNTAFIGNALLDYYELTGSVEALENAISASKFVADDLGYYEDANGICFRYTPMDNSKVYNASMLGAQLISRVYKITGMNYLQDLARLALQYVISNQNFDGSWYYGYADNQKWIDSFHTGFVLNALYDIMNYTDDFSFSDKLSSGVDFYVRKFLINSVPNYYDNSVYPLDIHSPAQGIVSVIKLKTLIEEHDTIIENLTRWVLKHMYDQEKGYFYFQKGKYFTNKIPFMRWSQAWMFYALTDLYNYLLCNKKSTNDMVS